MLTHCPGCQTVFRVTSAILRAAHGQVRCGRCNTQFDAIAQLLDQEEPDSDEAAGETNANESPATEQSPEDTPQDDNFAGIGHEDIVLEGNRIEISGLYTRPDGSVGAELEHSETIAEFNLDSQQWENPFRPEPALADDQRDADQDDEVRLIDDQARQDISADNLTDTEIDDIEDELNGVSLAADIASLEGEPPPRQSPFRQARPAPLPDFLSAAPASPPLPASPWAWRSAAVLAALLLGVQLLHHFRTELARHPSFGPLLMRAYASVGVPLTPRWLLSAYTIKQWGIVSDPQQAAVLRLRASITNTADFAQPYPLLRFSLEDRFGVVVGQRDFSPGEYLPNRGQASRLLAGKGAANIDLSIVDPGAQAVGFQLDSCLAQAGHIACTHSSVKP